MQTNFEVAGLHFHIPNETAVALKPTKSQPSKNADQDKMCDHAYFCIHNCTPMRVDSVIDQVLVFVVASGMETIRRPVAKKDKSTPNTGSGVVIHVGIRNHADRHTTIHFVENNLNLKYGSTMKCQERGRDVITYSLLLETDKLPDVDELKRHFDEFGRNEIYCTSEHITYVNYRFFCSAVDAMLAFSCNGTKSAVFPIPPKPIQYTRMLLDLERHIAQCTFGISLQTVQTSPGFAEFLQGYQHDNSTRVLRTCETFVKDYFSDTQPTDKFLVANATSIISSVLQEPYPTPLAALDDSSVPPANIAQLHKQYTANKIDSERGIQPEKYVATKPFEFKAPPITVCVRFHIFQCTWECMCVTVVCMVMSESVFGDL